MFTFSAPADSALQPTKEHFENEILSTCYNMDIVLGGNLTLNTTPPQYKITAKGVFLRIKMATIPKDYTHEIVDATFKEKTKNLFMNMSPTLQIWTL